MTNMKRVTIAFPKEVDDAVLALRQTEEFARCSYSEIVRYLVKLGLNSSLADDNAQKPAS